MKTVAVVGGGVSGLTTAYYLAKVGGPTCRVTVLDAASRMGGWVHTTRHAPSASEADDPMEAMQHGHFLFDKGPRSFRGEATSAFPPRDDQGRSRYPSSRFTADLIHRLDLMPDLVGVEKHLKSAHKRFILYDGRLEQIKLRSCPATKGLVRDAWNEVWKAPLASESGGRKPSTVPMTDASSKRIITNSSPDTTPSDSSESIHAFFERRFSRRLADGLVNAVIHGIYAGNAKELEIQSCLPWLPEYERRYGSVVRGALMSYLEQVFPDNASDEVSSELASGMLDPASMSVANELGQYSLYSFKLGLETLTLALQAELKSMQNVTMLYEHECKALKFHQFYPHASRDNTLCRRITLESQTPSGHVYHEVDHVVCALPAFALSDLFANAIAPTSTPPVDPKDITKVHQISTLLGQIPYVDVGLVNVAYKNTTFGNALEGFGFLVPSRERSEDVLGVVYDSTAFQHKQIEYVPARRTSRHGTDAFLRHPTPAYHPDVTRFTVMMGGHAFAEKFGAFDDPAALESSLGTRAVSAIARHLRVHEAPEVVDVSVLRRCIPQYTLGHADRLKRLHALLSDLPVSLVGAAYRGVSVHDCIASGVRCAANLILT